MDMRDLPARELLAPTLALATVFAVTSLICPGDSLPSTVRDTLYGMVSRTKSVYVTLDSTVLTAPRECAPPMLILLSMARFINLKPSLSLHL